MGDCGVTEWCRRDDSRRERGNVTVVPPSGTEGTMSSRRGGRKSRRLGAMALVGRLGSGAASRRSGYHWELEVTAFGGEGGGGWCAGSHQEPEVGKMSRDRDRHVWRQGHWLVVAGHHRAWQWCGVDVVGASLGVGGQGGVEGRKSLCLGVKVATSMGGGGGWEESARAMHNAPKRMKRDDFGAPPQHRVRGHGRPASVKTVKSDRYKSHIDEDVRDALFVDRLFPRGRWSAAGGATRHIRGMVRRSGCRRYRDAEMRGWLRLGEEGSKQRPRSRRHGQRGEQ
uniref:Uncharacterized protein n=1 Tax=Oryza punctata TaxID=4537 RepID=A0A1V1H1V0_ORYPU|nr:hypothetical protein [Oryza punctata]